MSSKCKHILELSTEEKQKFLESFNIVISDCDGVLWTMSMFLPNSGAAVNLLKEHGKQFKFVTNGGMWTDKKFTEKLEMIGVECTDNSDIVIPVKAIAKYVNTNYSGRQCQCLGTDIFYETLRDKGVNAVNVTPPRNINMSELQKAVSPDNCGLLVVDTNINMTFVDLAKIHQYVLMEDCEIFVSATDTRLSAGKHFPVIGVGKFLNVLWENSAKSPKIFGKPSSIMADYLVDEFNIKDHKRCLFVGDNLIVDIQFAIHHGFQTLFVLTGAHTKDEMLQQPLEDQPDYYADSLSDFIEFFKGLEQNTAL